MDAVTQVLIWIACTTVVVYGYFPAKKIVKNIIKKIKKAHKKRVKFRPKSKKQKKQEALERKMIQAATQREAIEFTNIRTGEKATKTVVVSSKYNPQKDQLYRGVIKRKGQSDRIIYLYQPRAEIYQVLPDGTTEKKYVGPITDTRTGHVLEVGTYAYRPSDSQTYFIGNLPKREVVSNVPFDYVRDSDHGDKAFEEYLSVQCSRDNAGNLEPVDLSNPQQKADYEAYLHQMATDRINDQDYFLSMVRHAKQQQQEDIDRAREEAEAERERAAEEKSNEESAKRTAAAEAKAKTTGQSSVDQANRAHDRSIAAKQRAYDIDLIQDNMVPDGNMPPQGGGPGHADPGQIDQTMRIIESRGIGGRGQGR